MGKKHFTILENNSEVMNALAAKLGLSDELAFYDVCSLDEPSLLSHIPRPALALLVIVPLTPTWDQSRKAEDAEEAEYGGSGRQESVLWFKQTIGNACGSIGLLHCALNGLASDYVLPGTILDKIRNDAIPLKMADRAQMLYDSGPFEDAHRSVSKLGDTLAPSGENAKNGQHFVAFVKAKDGHLWELEGSRMGPLDRGCLSDDEDILSPKALDLGFRKIIAAEHATGGQDLRFSCIALARRAS